MKNFKITITEADERELEHRLATTLMLAEDREIQTTLLREIRKARAEGGWILHATIGDTRFEIRLR